MKNQEPFIPLVPIRLQTIVAASVTLRWLQARCSSRSAGAVLATLLPVVLVSVLMSTAAVAQEAAGAQQTALVQNGAVAQEKAMMDGEHQHLILVVGAPGAEVYQAEFSSWAARWEQACQQGQIDCTKIGVPAVNSSAEIGTTGAIASAASSSGASSSDVPSSDVPSSDVPSSDVPSSDVPWTGDATGKPASDLQQLEAAIAAAAHNASREPLWLVFIGHGTFDGRTASLNLQGPDMTAEQLAELLKPIQRPVAVIICASCSAPFINQLSAPNRIIVSATKDGTQSQYSRFGDAMSQAIGSLEADINRDGQTSLLEAWLFASRRTAEFYKSEGRLATEHSLLDDNGDGQGVRSEVYEGDRIARNVQDAEKVDGRLAARWHLVRNDEERQLTSEQRQTRDTLEEQIEALRSRKAEVDEAEYLQQLESLLIPLAELYESLASKKPE